LRKGNILWNVRESMCTQCDSQPLSQLLNFRTNSYQKHEKISVSPGHLSLFPPWPRPRRRWLGTHRLPQCRVKAHLVACSVRTENRGDTHPAPGISAGPWPPETPTIACLGLPPCGSASRAPLTRQTCTGGRRQDTRRAQQLVRWRIRARCTSLGLPGRRRS
jgi:hypothetical protein